MKEFLSDPAWQGIGVLIALLFSSIGLFYATKQKIWLYLTGGLVLVILGVWMGIELRPSVADVPTPTSTNSLASAETPTLGATKSPTETPEPTETATEIPRPTDTATPPPTSTPTETPEPTKTPTPIPTDTPIPTFTATSTNTPIPTPISTVLAPRETWVQDGVALTLAGGFYDVDNSCIGMIFEFKNEGSDTIIVAGKARNFRAEDNLGQTWKLTMLGGTWVSFNRCENNIDEKFLERALGPGEEFDKYSDFSEKGFYVGFTGPLTNNAVEYLDVIVDGFSRITNARWRIPVKH